MLFLWFSACMPDARSPAPTPAQPPAAGASGPAGSASGPAGSASSPADLPVLGEVPDFTLTDQAGATVTRATLLGKVWVADFFFTSCPDICPILSAHMAEVQGHYKGDDRVRLVSFSVDPGTDTPTVLAAYAGKFGADAQRWHLLTGPIDTVKPVVVDGFKMLLEVQGGEGQPATVLHGERFVVVDAEGKIRAYPDPKEPGKAGIWQAVDALLAGR